MAKEDSSAHVEKIIAHINNGLEVQEILDLWHVIFPQYRGVWFDEDECQLHYAEKIERVSQRE
jgi:hypothetical protein